MLKNIKEISSARGERCENFSFINSLLKELENYRETDDVGLSDNFTKICEGIERIIKLECKHCPPPREKIEVLQPFLARLNESLYDTILELSSHKDCQENKKIALFFENRGRIFSVIPETLCRRYYHQILRLTDKGISTFIKHRLKTLKEYILDGVKDKDSVYLEACFLDFIITAALNTLGDSKLGLETYQRHYNPNAAEILEKPWEISELLNNVVYFCKKTNGFYAENELYKKYGLQLIPQDEVKKIQYKLIYKLDWSSIFLDKSLNESHSLNSRETSIMTEIHEIYSRSTDSAELLFKELAANGYEWSNILKELIFAPELSAFERQENKEIMEGLIFKRDELEAYFYNESVRKLFPVTFFSIIPSERQKNKEDLSGIHLKYYTFDISLLITGNSGKQPTLVTIDIIAPGSRTLTSDIDTTVKVRCHHGERMTHLESKLKVIGWPEEVLSSATLYDGTGMYQVNLEAALQSAIIYYFNQLSFEKIKMTSAESRDSNVYSDGFLKEEEGYPKFIAGKDIMLSDGNSLLTESTQVFYKSQKRQKQIYEFAASLMPLRCYYDKANQEWNDFETAVRKQLEEIIDEANQAKVADNFNEVLKEVEKFHQYYINKLKEADQLYKQKYLNGISLPDSVQDIPKDRKNDFAVYCHQGIYVRCLVTLARHKAKITRKLGEIESNKTKLQEAYVTKLEAQEEFDAVKHRPKSAKNAQDELAAANQRYIDLQRSLLKVLSQLAVLYNTQQELQIQANLFAYEGYINRSAVYHVVDWIQSAGALPIAKQQVVVGSILQQVGFRLLHSFIYREQALSEGEIAYRVAKYGERVAEMFFGELDKEWKKVVDNKALPQLEVLRRLQLTGFKGEFSKAILKIINEDSRFVEEIKKNERIPVHLKGQKALERIQENIYRFHNSGQETVSEHDRKTIDGKKVSKWLKDNEKELIDGSSKTLMFAYQARLTKTNGYLWGEGYSKAELQESVDGQEKRKDGNKTQVF